MRFLTTLSAFFFLTGCANTPTFLLDAHTESSPNLPEPREGSSLVLIDPNVRQGILIEKFNGKPIPFGLHSGITALEFESQEAVLEVGIYVGSAPLNSERAMKARLSHDFQPGEEYTISFSGTAPFEGIVTLISDSQEIAKVAAKRIHNNFSGIGNNHAGNTSSSTGTQPFLKEPPAPNGMSTIYIYRPRNDAVGIYDATISINDEEVAELSRGEYAVIPIPPGQYRLTGVIDHWLFPTRVWNQMQFECDSGKDCYVRWEAYKSTGGSFTTGPKFSAKAQIVSETRATKEMAGLDKQK